MSRSEPIRNEKDECSFVIEIYSPSLAFIELANVRSFGQLKVFRRIREAGHCPFCPGNLGLYHMPPVLWETDHWLVTPNQWPYPHTDVHLLVILRNHAERVHELHPSARREMVDILERVEQERAPGGGVVMRFGDPIAYTRRCTHKDPYRCRTWKSRLMTALLSF
jgi:hypothetical protein